MKKIFAEYLLVVMVTNIVCWGLYTLYIRSYTKDLIKDAQIVYLWELLSKPICISQ